MSRSLLVLLNMTKLELGRSFAQHSDTKGCQATRLASFVSRTTLHLNVEVWKSTAMFKQFSSKSSLNYLHSQTSFNTQTMLVSKYQRLITNLSKINGEIFSNDDDRLFQGLLNVLTILKIHFIFRQLKIDFSHSYQSIIVFKDILQYFCSLNDSQLHSLSIYNPLFYL